MYHELRRKQAPTADSNDAPVLVAFGDPSLPTTVGEEAVDEDPAMGTDTERRMHPFFWAGFQLIGDGSPAGRR